MFRAFVWVLTLLNVALITSFSFFAQPTELVVHLGPEWQLAVYLSWLAGNAFAFVVLFTKAYQVGEGAISFLGISVNGSVALIIITTFCILVSDANPNVIFVFTYRVILGATTFGQLMTNLYCFEKEPAH